MCKERYQIRRIIESWGEVLVQLNISSVIAENCFWNIKPLKVNKRPAFALYLNWLAKFFKQIYTVQFTTQKLRKLITNDTMRLHYNADPIKIRSPRGSQIFFQYTVCGIHNASCENRTPCEFPSQVWHQLIFPKAVLTGHSIYNAYVNGDHHV